MGGACAHDLFSEGATTIIHDTPKRSATMPKREEKKVLVSGICTCPPSARAANSRSASASSGAESDSEKPWKLGLPEASPVGSHHRRIADAEARVHHLVLGTGRHHAGWLGLRAVLEAHEHGHFRAERFAVELERLVAAAVEEQVGLDLHCSLLLESWGDNCEQW